MAVIAKPGNSTVVLKSLLMSLRLAAMRVGFAIGGWLMPKATLHRAFRLFGTPPDEKKRVVFDGGHVFPFSRMIKDSLDWLDRHLGVP